MSVTANAKKQNIVCCLGFSYFTGRMKIASLTTALLVAVMGTAADEPQANPPGIGLKWEADGTASAQLEKCSLDKVLQSLSEQGRWQIFVEPELRLQVTTRFKNLTHSQALRRLLSDVNFAIIPSPKASSRLLVYKTSSEKAVVRIVPTKRLAKLKKISRARESTSPLPPPNSARRLSVKSTDSIFIGFVSKMNNKPEKPRRCSKKMRA